MKTSSKFAIGSFAFIVVFTAAYLTMLYYHVV